jgi:peptide chain release factor 2
VPVLPAVDEEVDVPDEDIRVDVYRSSGPGGQSVNTTDSAVRITHLPTGIVVSCQNEKSQHQNRAVALRVLKAKLAELERQKRADQLDELRGAVQNVGFGSQIRSYVLHPYQMVKDLRSEHETGNVQAVLDGDLDELLEAELRRRVRGAQTV